MNNQVWLRRHLNKSFLQIGSARVHVDVRTPPIAWIRIPVDSLLATAGEELWILHVVDGWAYARNQAGKQG